MKNQCLLSVSTFEGPISLPSILDCTISPYSARVGAGLRESQTSQQPGFVSE